MSSQKASNDVKLAINEKPVPSEYDAESPEDYDENVRKAFFSHTNHFFILTAAGKPVFTRHLFISTSRYGDVYRVSALCASYSAILPKLLSIFVDQDLTKEPNTLRYIKTRSLLTVFLMRRNVLYVCVTKSKTSYKLVQEQLEQLHTQVWAK